MSTSNPAPRGSRSRSAQAVRRVSPLAALLVLLAGGCSSSDTPLAPVEGTITRNGRPVAHAQVTFMVDDDGRGPRATGVTDEAGRFRLATDDGKDGCPVGRHRVCVIDTTVTAERFGMVAKRLAPDKAAPVKPAGKSTPIPPAYGRPAETPLRAEVRAGAQTIDFQVP
ncbi:carboxypeptidase regulatory-like domain-containing protein [Gemmata sp. G18]|uniref:Carboxypeptidase regulatory-like domain-containing protein n=1 Tax=Gemmata palustris TaxID=2822762 RepID=A0ABS5BPW8_9BACT|nr:carboxypeptidase-like regulatory domain-containing protein [Gemmata palustris]MBP3955779.1 carboxypeptidase regulatory-like domain-containing protein [Gemmata palustris]